MWTQLISWALFILVGSLVTCWLVRALIQIRQALAELQAVEAENLANGIQLPPMPPVDVLGLTEPKATPSAQPLRNLAAADVQVAGPRMELRLWSSLLVLARCDWDDVVIASFPDTPEGMLSAHIRSREVAVDPEREWTKWQSNDSELLYVSIVRVTDGGSSTLGSYHIDDRGTAFFREAVGPEESKLNEYREGKRHDHAIQKAADDSAIAAAAEQSATGGAAAATAAGS